MNNILKIALTLAVGIVLAGCYNDFDNPAPAKEILEVEPKMKIIFSLPRCLSRWNRSVSCSSSPLKEWMQ